jgi:DNA polymerase III delta subunit
MVAIYASKLPEALQGRLPAVVLLWGEDAGAIRQAAASLKAAVAARTGLALDDPFATETLTLAYISEDEARLHDAVMTLSLSAPHRLITLGHVSGTERTETIKALTEQVAMLAKEPLNGVTLLLPIPGHLEKKHTLVKVVEGLENGLAVRFFSDSGRDLETFLKAELARHGSHATREALEMMAASLGADREIARREVEKVVLYAGSERSIQAAHVQATLCGATPIGVFLLTEAILSRQTARADALLEHLIEAGEDLNGALMLTVAELGKVAAAQSWHAAGTSEADILTKSGKAAVPPAANAAFWHAV